MDCSLNLVLDLPVGSSKPLPKLFCSFGLTLPSCQTCTNSDPNTSQRSPPEVSVPQQQCRAHTKTKSCWEQRATLRNSGFWTAVDMSPATLTFSRTTRCVPAKTILIPSPIKERKGMKQLYLQFSTMSRRGKDRGKKNHNYLNVHNMHLCTKL